MEQNLEQKPETIEIVEEEVRAEEIETVETVSETKPELEETTERKMNIEAVQHRSMDIDMSPIDEEKRTVRIAVSSEEPVQRSFGSEVLEHSEEAVDLGFLNSGRAPLLLDHDPEKQIGVIESVSLDGDTRRLRAIVRFGRNGLAKETFDDVIDGIRANISVGYSITELERGRSKDEYIAKRWRPVEASLVSIPADVTVGVGRSSESSNKPVIETDFQNEELIMSEVDIAAVEANARKSAQKDAAQIIELAARHNMSNLASEAIANGTSIEEFRGVVLDKIGSESALENKDVGLTNQQRQSYSLVRAISALANPNDRKAQEAAKFEMECSRAAADAYGANPQGLMIPSEVLRNWKRDLNSSDDSTLFSDDYRGSEFIDVLRNSSSVMSAGARMLSGLSGDVVIPKKTAAASAGWIATEGGAASESEFTTGSVTLAPKQIGAFTDMTRQLRQQSSMDVEMLVRDDLAQALALAIDLGGLEGSGASGQPTGLLNTGSLTKVTTWAAANPTFAEVVTLETAVANANALMGNLAYIAPTAMVGAMKTTEKASGTAQFLTDGNELNGYGLVRSNQGTAGNLYFGNWSDLLIGMWSGVDITVDPYSLSTTGTVRVVAFQTCDVAVRHIESFAYGNDTV